MAKLAQFLNIRKYLTLYLTLLLLASIPLTVWGLNKIRELRSRAAGTATLYLTPASQNVNQNTNFTVQIRENSTIDPVNAVQANLTYDATKLDYISTDFTGSAFGVAAESSGGGGSIRIARGVIGGQPAVTGDQLVASVTFKAKTNPGVTAVSFAAGSIIARSTDNTNILNTTTPGSYTVFNPPPTVSITSPANNALVSGSINVNATANDDLAITKVEILVDNALISTLTTAPYSYSLNTSLFSNASHTIAAKAYDSSTSATASVNVTVDNALPTATITSPTNGSTVSGTVNIAATASDNQAVNRVEFYLDNTLLISDTTSPYSYSWNSTTATDGTHNLKAKAIDGVGNSFTATVSVTVTNQKMGDINGDSKVDILDLSLLLTFWNTNNTASDLNQSGLVDILDLSILLTKWGT